MNSEVIGKLDKMVEKELHKIVEKGDITPVEVENATKAMCLLEKIKHYTEGSYEGEGYSQGYRSYPRYYESNSYARGRNPMNGRYVSRDDGMMANSNGYGPRNSGAYDWDYNQGMVENIENMRDQSRSGQERRMLDHWLDSAHAMTV